MSDDESLRIDFVFPRFKLMSGAERSILELSAALAAQGHRPRLVCHQFHESCRPVLAECVELVETGARLDYFGNRYLNALFDYARAFGLLRHIARDADAVMLCGPSLPLVAWLRGVRRQRSALVYHCFEPPRALYQDFHEIVDRAGAAGPLLAIALRLYRFLDRRLVRLPGSVTTVAPFSAGRIQEVYGRPAVAVTHAMAREPLDAAREEGAAKRFSLITVNYLHPRKRVDLIIRALAELGGEETLQVVGDGPERPRLESLARELGVAQRVSFRGFVPDEELPRAYCESECYTHACKEESFGMSVIEAAYCGLPVVAVAEGGVLDTVKDGETGVLVEPDRRAFAAGLRDVLGMPDRGRAMGQRGRDRVAERYTWERGAADVLHAIRAAL